jgi:uncharacterized membrane protein YfcA
MDLAPLVIALVALGFLVAAAAHTSAGLGGGSTYTAILAMAGFPATLIPPISLIFNLLATTIGSINFLRGGHFRPRLLTPFLCGSLPAAALGGALPLSPRLFFLLLLASLLAVLLRLLASRWLPLRDPRQIGGVERWGLGITLGALLGFVAGAVGIGGGIFLVPLIRLLAWGSAPQAAAAGSLFIWINSAVGLSSRLLTQGWPEGLSPALLILVPAVALGAVLGSTHGALKWPARRVELALTVVIALACLLLARRVALIW